MVKDSMKTPFGRPDRLDEYRARLKKWEKAQCHGFVWFRIFRPSRWHRWREETQWVDTCIRCNKLRVHY